MLLALKLQRKAFLSYIMMGGKIFLKSIALRERNLYQKVMILV